MPCPDLPPCNPCSDPCIPDYTDLGCCDFPKTKCVIYDGDDIPCLNITKNENLNQILQHLKDIICSLEGSGYATFDFSCFASEGITTEQEFVEFISSLLCSILGTQTPNTVTSLSDLYSLIQSLTTTINTIKNQTLIACFQTLSGLTSPQNISDLLTAIQIILCDHESRLDALESGSINIPITVNNVGKDVEITASGISNHTLTAKVVIDPDGTNSITTSAAGLLCSSPNVTVVDTSSINFSASGVKNHTITGDVKISATVGNAASILADGIYVNPASASETPLVATDSTSIDFNQSGVNGHTITADVILNPSLSNILQSTPTGLLVTAASVSTPITPIDTNTIDLTVSGADNHTIKADAIISPVANNALQALVSGLYVDGSVVNNAWLINGNSGTNSLIHFIGTTDTQALRFKVANVIAGGIDNTTDNMSFGTQALFTITSGISNSAFGRSALRNTTTGQFNTAIGHSTLLNNVAGHGAVAVGFSAMQFANNTSAPFSNTNTAIGNSALRGSIIASANTGISNTAIGHSSMLVNTTGSTNTAVGVNTLKANTIGSQNTAIGDNSMLSNIDGNWNTAIGWESIYSNTSGQFNTAIGTSSLRTNTTGQYNTANGYQALFNNLTGSNNIAIGSQTLTSNSTGSRAIAIGHQAMYYANDTAVGFNNTNIAIGYSSLTGLPTPSLNTGLLNTALGYQTLSVNSTGDSNTAIGANALLTNTLGDFNTAVGTPALNSNSTGSQNTALGASALLANNTGDKNTALGFQADVSAGNLTNTTAIGANAQVAASNSMVLGSINGTNGATADTNVAIGITIPTERLHVNGNVRFSGALMPNNLPGSAGEVLTSAGAGVAPVWAAPGGGGSGWLLLGNSGTNASTNFIGTTDNIALSFRVNNQKAGQIGVTATANTSLGYQTLNTISGTLNTAIGYNAMISSTSANANTAIGCNSLFTNTIGDSNTAVGSDALYTNLDGNNNSAFGYRALYTNSIGDANTAIGYSSLFVCNGNGNTAIGFGALQNSTTSDSNTAIGSGALATNTTGSFNTAIGTDADVSVGNLVNAIAIGYNAVVSANDNLVLGRPGTSVVVGDTQADASAILDLTSTTLGFLPPRMTDAEKAAIVSPVAGLTVYVTDGTAGDASTGVMETYNGATWKKHW